MSRNQRLARVSEIIDAHGSQPSQLIAILQDTQSAFNYLSQEDMTLIAHRLGMQRRSQPLDALMMAAVHRQRTGAV